MKLNISNLEDSFLVGCSEAVKLDKIMALVKQKSVPIKYILPKLTEIKAGLKKIEHEINFILIDKSYTPKKFNGIVIFDEVKTYFSGDDVLCFELFDDTYSIDDIYQKYYIDISTYRISGEFSKEEIEERKKRIYSFLNTVRDELKNCDVYLLKSDIDSLFDKLTINHSDIAYIKNGYLFNGNRSQEFKKDQLWEEFNEESQKLGRFGIDDIFELWCNDDDKKTFFDRIEVKTSSSQTQRKPKNIDINKELTPKSKTSYLNIIQALKDELIECGTYKNQDELIKHLSEKYSGYSGLSESNLRDKFAEANKIK